MLLSLGALLLTLVFAVVQLIVYRDTSLPFGPGLAVGIVLTWLGWRWIAPAAQAILYNEVLLLMFFGGGAGIMLLMSAIFRLFRRPDMPEPV